jgi:hypothetical protein
MNNDDETQVDSLKYFGGGSIAVSLVLFLLSASLLRGSGAATFGLVSGAWFFLGVLAIKTGRIIDRLASRIAVLEANVSVTQSPEVNVDSLTDN